MQTAKLGSDCSESEAETPQELFKDMLTNRETLTNSIDNQSIFYQRKDLSSVMKSARTATINTQ